MDRYRRNSLIFGLVATLSFGSYAETTAVTGMLETICGTPDFQGVEEYDGSLGPSIAFVDRHQTAVGQVQWNYNLDSIFNSPGNVSGARICSGTLIARNLFLTAAHCLEDQMNPSYLYPRDNNSGMLIRPEVAAQNMHVNFQFQRDSSGRLRQQEEVPVRALR